jgi:hypothetical protein
MPAAACFAALLDHDKSHRGPADRLADRRGIGGVVLAPPHIGLGVSRRHQPHVMPALGDLAPPVMRRRACLDADPAARQFGKEWQDLLAAQRTSFMDGSRRWCCDTPNFATSMP